MSWLVVGARGQLGMALIHELSKRNIAYSSSSSDDLDVTNEASVDRYVNMAQPKVIVNAAAYTNVDGAESNRLLAWNVNADAAAYLAFAARSCGALFVQISTDYVFSGKSHHSHEVSEMLSPESVYGESKAAGEKLVADIYGAGTYIFRTAWLYSARRKNFAKTMTIRALGGEVVNVVNNQYGQPTYAADLAERIVDAVTQQIPLGIYHATNSGATNWFEFAQEIYRLAGADIGLVVPLASDHYPQIAVRPEYSVLSHQRWLEIGIEPMRNWQDALTEAMPAIIGAVKSGE